MSAAGLFPEGRVEEPQQLGTSPGHWPKTPAQCVALYEGNSIKPWWPQFWHQGGCGHCGGSPSEHEEYER